MLLTVVASGPNQTRGERAAKRKTPIFLAHARRVLRCFSTTGSAAEAAAVAVAQAEVLEEPPEDTSPDKTSIRFQFPSGQRVSIAKLQCLWNACWWGVHVLSLTLDLLRRDGYPSDETLHQISIYYERVRKEAYHTRYSYLLRVSHAMHTVPLKALRVTFCHEMLQWSWRW